MANLGTGSYLWLLAVMMDFSSCSGDALHHSLGLALPPGMRFRLTPKDCVSFVPELQLAFMYTLFSLTLLISFMMNNIVSTLQMRPLTEKKKYF